MTQSGQTLGLHQFFISGKPQRRHFVDKTNVVSPLYIQSNTGGFVLVHLGPDERIFLFCCGTRGSFNGNLGQQNFPVNGATGIQIIGLCGA